MKHLPSCLYACFAAALTTLVWISPAAAAERRSETTSREGLPDKLLAIAHHALRQAEEDRLEELWATSSGLLKSRVPRAEFVEATRKALRERGEIKAREWIQIKQVLQSESTPMIPAGRYANVEFSVLLPNGAKSVERVSLSRERDRWHFLGYVTTPRSKNDGVEATTSGAEAPTDTPRRPDAAEAHGTGASQQEKIEKLVHAWAAAWSAKNVQAYLAAYAPSFTPNNGLDRGTWEAARRARIEGKARIRVTVADMSIHITESTATAIFTQTYRAGRLRESGRKTLLLRRSGEQWLIQEESMQER